MVPIIIPITNTKEIPCIIQEGVRYCEEKETDPKEIGYVFILCAVAILWFVFWRWLSEDGDNILVFIGGGVLLPLVVLGLVFIY